MAADDQLAFADGLYRRGLHDLAAQEYQRLLDAHPDAPEAAWAGFRLGESRRQLGDAAAARRVWEQTAARHAAREGGARANLRLAQIHLEAGQAREAVGRTRQALTASDLPPDLTDAITYELGRGLQAAGDRAGASEAWTRVASREPPTPYAGFAMLALGQALRGTDPAAALRWLGRAERTGPTDRVRAEAAFLQGEIAQAQNRPGPAADHYRRLARTWPDDLRAPAARLAEAWSRLRAEQPRPARDLARAALGEAPDAPAWLYLLANAARQLGDWAEADTAYERLLRAAPGHELAASARFERAVLALQQDRPDVAVALLREGDAAGGTEADWVLAEALGRTRDVEAAVAAYRRIIEAAPDTPRALEARFRIAQVHEQAERWADAATAHREFARAHPRHEKAEEAWFRAAGAALQAERPADARSAFASLIRAFPEGEHHYEAAYRLALLELQVGETGQAAPRLQALAGGESPFAARAAWVLASVRDQADDLPAAAELYRQALAADPPPAPRPEILVRLGGILTRQEKADEAARAFTQALDAGAEDLAPDLLEWVARTSLEAERHADALAAADALAQVAPGGEARAAAGWIGGEAARKLGRLDEARARLARAAGVSAAEGGVDGVRAALALARIHLGADRPAEAEPLFRQAVERSGASGLEALRAEAYFGLAESAEARKRWDEAARLFLAVAVLYDDDRWAPESLIRAARAFGEAGQPARRREAEAELRQRFPEQATKILNDPEIPAP